MNEYIVRPDNIEGLSRAKLQINNLVFQGFMDKPLDIEIDLDLFCDSLNTPSISFTKCKLGKNFRLRFINQISNVHLRFDEVEYITCNSFADNAAITHVTIGNGVHVIEHGAFARCKNLMYVNFDGNTTLRSFSGFEDTGVTSNNPICDVFVIPESVKDISNAFIRCDKLAHVELPKTLTIIGENAFMGCSNLVSVDFYDGDEIVWKNDVVTIGSNAFANCVKLVFPEDTTLATIFPSLSTIGEEAFSHCTSLNIQIVSNTVVTIKSRAFEHCMHLGRIASLKNTSLRLFAEVFFGAGINKLTVLDTAKMSETATNTYQSIIVDVQKLKTESDIFNILKESN